ncbi:hypothetical protein P2318_13455 [Myxococcaceae bacterium GXIMD 01537]
MDSNPNRLDFDCDWRFGLNLRSSLKGTVGYLLDWSGCGGLSLKKDIEVWNPYSTSGQRIVSGKTVKCIGLIETFRFEGGQNDPIRIKAYVSRGTAADIRAKLSKPLTNTKLKLAWYIVDFDESDKRWFEAAFVKSPKTADASIDSVNGELQISIDNAPTRVAETLDVNVFGFELQVVPADKKQAELEFASGPTQRMVKQWGESG